MRLTFGLGEHSCGIAVPDNRSDPLPEYATPPVIEVVCGISFAPLHQFQAVHYGLLWERMKDSFPNIEEHPPFAMPVEQLEPLTIRVSEVQLMDRPPLPRVWFLDQPGNAIIQVQRDAFLHNWRKLKPDDRYPRFRTVIESFQQHLKTFGAFVADTGFGRITPIQCELTYINHIFEGPLWSKGKPLNHLLPDFQWREKRDRFLPTYEGVNWRTAYRLPEGQGRLHATTQIGFLRAAGQPLVSLELKARGINDSKSVEDIWPWFEMAHEWIVRGFTDMTSEKAQNELWGRTR